MSDTKLVRVECLNCPGKVDGVPCQQCKGSGFELVTPVEAAQRARARAEAAKAEAASREPNKLEGVLVMPEGKNARQIDGWDV